MDNHLDKFVGYVYPTATQFLAVKTLNRGLHAFDERRFGSCAEAENWLRSIGCADIVIA